MDKITKIICNQDTADTLFNNPNFALEIDDSYLDWQIDAQLEEAPQIRGIDYSINVFSSGAPNDYV